MISLNSTFGQKPGVYFALHDFGKNISGVERSCLKRANLFVKYVGVHPVIVTFGFNPDLMASVDYYKKIGWLDASVEVVNPYLDFFQSDREIGEASHALQVPIGFCSDVVTENGHQRFFDKNGRLAMYVIWRDFSSKKPERINYFLQGRKIRKEYFDSAGRLLLSCVLDRAGRSVQEDFYTADGHRRLSKRFRVGYKEADCVEVFSNNGMLLQCFSSEAEWIGEWLSGVVKTPKNMFVVDGGPKYLEPLRYFKGIGQKSIISVLHGNHVLPGENILNGIMASAQRRKLLERKDSVDACVVLTKQQTGDIKERFPKGCCLVTIPHPAELKAENVDFKKRNRNKIVAFVRLAKEKRVDDMVKIMSLIVEKDPDKLLFVYGNGPERFFLQDLIDRLCLSKNVFLMGYVDNVERVLEESIFSIITSKVEAFPLSILESLSCGCPVISYNIRYGPADMIEHGFNGFLVQEGDISQAAALLEQALSDKSLLKAFSDNAYQSAKRYSPETIAELWHTLMHDCGL